MTEFKKYKNRKIYNKNTSKYATLSEVYYASLGGPVSVIDATTGGDITDDTVIRGALEVFSAFTLKDLATQAISIGQKYDLKIAPQTGEIIPAANEEAFKLVGKGLAEKLKTPPGERLQSPDFGVSVQEDADLFSGKGAQ